MVTKPVGQNLAARRRIIVPGDIHKANMMTTKKGGRRVTNARKVNLLEAEGSEEAVRDEYTDLVRSAATGDAEALERLLMRVQEVAWRFSTSVCGHADDTEDAMQEALLKTYRYVGRIREPGAFKPWLYRTVRNACLMGRRKRAGEPTRLRSLDDVVRLLWEEYGLTGRRRTSSSLEESLTHVARPLPRDRVPAGDGGTVHP